MRVREIEYKFGKGIETEKLDSPERVAEFVRKIACPIKENFIVLFVNNKNKVLGYEIVSIGTINESLVHPREVFRGAILLSASSILVAHNHPSGDTKPSKEDVEATSRLKDCGKIIGIPLLDHIVVGEDTFYSFREDGNIIF
jgi:DNA repair protein RadC